ncbi:MAG: rhodanese-like domain-containing protein [Enterococcus sp.]
MSFLVWLNTILFSILLALLLNEAYLRIQTKRSVKILTEEEFKENMRKAQVIDVREKADFDGGHILGARNIPYSVLANSIASIRKDQPVYLYDQKRTLSIRAAIKLKKQGYKELYMLKGGYQGWTGKTKVKNPL